VDTPDRLIDAGRSLNCQLLIVVHFLIGRPGIFVEIYERGQSSFDPSTAFQMFLWWKIIERSALSSKMKMMS
jgi:hypothetical protein